MVGAVGTKGFFVAAVASVSTWNAPEDESSEDSAAVLLSRRVPVPEAAMRAISDVLHVYACNTLLVFANAPNIVQG